MAHSGSQCEPARIDELMKLAFGETHDAHPGFSDVDELMQLAFDNTPADADAAAADADAADDGDDAGPTA